MPGSQTKSEYVRDLRSRIDEHRRTIRIELGAMDEAALAWRPDGGSWSVLDCVDHLNRTHEHHAAFLHPAIADAVPADPGDDAYRPTWLARVYIPLAFHPRLRFAAAAALQPRPDAGPSALDELLGHQDELDNLLDAVGPVSLTRTHVPGRPGLRFNLGDSLRIVVHHDDLHLRQARTVLDALNR